MPSPRIGLLLPQYDCTIEQTLAAARAGDAAGLDVWIAGQLFPISDQPEKTAFEPLTLMGALAAVTSRARLGFMVLAAPYLPEIYLAKALITLDHLSGGRIDVGLGAGWREEEFAALGQDFGSGASRRERLERTLDAIGALAAGEQGAATSAGTVRSGPPSVQQPRPPLWIAGKGPKILELVGRRADWANFARGISVEDFRAAGEVVAAAAGDAGRADGGPKLSLTGTFLGAADPDEVARVVERRAGERGRDVDAYRAQLRRSNAFVGTPEAIADQLRPYVDAGCAATILWPLDGDHAGAPTVLARVAELL